MVILSNHFEFFWLVLCSYDAAKRDGESHSNDDKKQNRSRNSAGLDNEESNDIGKPV